MNSRKDNSVCSRGEAFQNVALAFTASLAFLSASCCILPLALTIVGLGGAWLSFLGPLVVYREIILIIVTAIIAYLWFRISTTGGRPIRRRRGVIMASVASLATGVAWTAPLWEWDVTNMLMDIWTSGQ